MDHNEKKVEQDVQDVAPTPKEFLTQAEGDQALAAFYYRMHRLRQLRDE